MEDYLLDQFPFRDSFRTLKAVWTYDLLGQKDNNGIYIAEGTASKLDATLDEKQLKLFTDKMNSLHETYFPQANVYCAVIPTRTTTSRPATATPRWTMRSSSLLWRRSFPGRPMWISPAASPPGLLRNRLPLAPGKAPEGGGHPGSGHGSHPARLGELHAPTPFRASRASTTARRHCPCRQRISSISPMRSPRAVPSRVRRIPVPRSMIRPSLKPGRLRCIFKRRPGGAHHRKPQRRKRQESGHLPGFLTARAWRPCSWAGYRTVTLVDVRYVTSSYLGQFVDFSQVDDVLLLYSTTVINSAGILR